MPANRPRWPFLQRFVVLLLAACLVACEDLDVPEQPPTRPPSSQARPTTKPSTSGEDQTWLVMLYEDADDETLEEDMVNDLNEAELVGSTDQVRIVAQMDRYDGGFDGDGDWTTTKRFLVEQDGDLENLASEELDDLGEVDMADADTLIDFVRWAAESYPADKYVLIMSDHGAGWPGGWSDPEPSDGDSSGIALEESFGDMLFLMEMGKALDQVLAETGIGQLELIGFDACLMSQIEVYSAMTPYARYAVASQEIEPSLGWAYAAFLGSLVENPGMDGAELSRSIVSSYIDEDTLIVDDEARARYVERAYDHPDGLTAEDVAQEEGLSITLSAVDLAAIPALVHAVDVLAVELSQSDLRRVAAARRYAQSFETVFDPDEPNPYIDLGSFAELLKQKIDDKGLQAAADGVLAAIEAAVIDEKHGDEKAGATGISIHFPNSALYKDDEAGADSYTTVASTFANESLWDDYLAFHYTKRPMPALSSTPPTPAPAAEVSAPGSAPISVAPVTVSAKTVSKTKPVLIQSSVSGDDVAFVYLYVAQIDADTGATRVVDMDFLEAEDTREVGGVFYPDWGADGEIPLEFEWDGSLFAINDGSSAELALLEPDDYGASAEEAVYTVEGMYTTAKGKKQRRALLLFSDGELVQALGYTGTDENGAMRELTPKRGDRFTILEPWSSDNGDGTMETATQEGATLVFGEDNLTWEDARAPKGEYLVGFVAEDFDGNWYESHATVKVR